MRSSIARLPIVGPAFVDFARMLRDPATERAIQGDWHETWHELHWLREAVKEPALGAPRLLIVSLTDMVYQLKLEGMLASALKLHGWRPIILANSRTNTRARRYFSAFGIGDFLYLEDFTATSAEIAQACAAAATLLRSELTFQQVKAWTFEGSWIGPQILSTVSRTRREGAPDPRDPDTRVEIERLLPDILARVLVAGRVVAASSARLGLVNESNYAFYGPFVDRLILAGIPVVQMTQPWRDDALTFKRLTAETRRVHPSSVSAHTFGNLLRRPWGADEESAVDAVFADRYSGKWFLQARNQPNTRAVSATALAQRLGLDPAKKTATVFSHILWDANLFYGEDLFQDYGEWFVETVRAAAGNPALNWLIKLHPANLWKRARERVEGEYSELRLIHAHIGKLPDHVKLLTPDTDISTASLFEAIEYGVTVRGTAGMELPCFGKPTLTAGTGRYSGLGFTIDSASPREYLDRLAHLQSLPPMDQETIEKARRHAHAVLLLRPWRMKSFRSVFNYEKRGSSPLDHNLRAVAASIDDARGNDDLEKWACWATSDDVDYLEKT